MTAALIAMAAFLLPPFVALVSPRTGRRTGVWLVAALCEAPLCMLFSQPLAFFAAIESMVMAVIAVSVSRPYPPHLAWQQRQERRELRAFQRDLEQFGQRDLELAAAADPYPGDRKVA